MKDKVKLIIMLELQTKMLKVLLNKCIKFSKSIKIYTVEPIIHFTKLMPLPKNSNFFLLVFHFLWIHQIICTLVI